MFSLGICLVGSNLNLTTLRGSASLGLLAIISEADKYDQLTNEAGVQRSPAEKHAREALAYALEAPDVDPETDPRAFTEVILNGRDTSPFVFRDLQNAKELSVDEVLSGKHEAVRVWVDSAMLDHSPSFNSGDIQISRVDGNHRLLISERLIDKGELKADEFPVVPFALFLGLSPNQERKIFVDINGNHKNMSKSLMLNFQAKRTAGSSSSTTEQLAGWIALRLCSPGMVFSEMVNLGGDLKGYRLLHNTNPPLTLVGIANAMKSYVTAAAYLRQRYSDSPEFLVEIINTFYSVLRDKFPQGFERHHEYVILKAIGLTTLGRLAGTMYSNSDSTPTSFDPGLAQKSIQVLIENIDFGKFKWAGYTGGSGMEVLFKQMQRVLNENGFAEYSKPRAAI